MRVRYVCSLATIAVAALLAWPGAAAAQQATVAGSVNAQDTGQPIRAAQVTVVGTRLGALTDQDGRFRIMGIADSEVTLRATALGYRSSTVTVSAGTTDVRLSLNPTAIELDQIVVTGTAGGIQRRAVGNVVSRIDAAEAVALAPIPNMQSLINARAPGVVVMPGSGMVGSGSKIRVRGSSSLSLSNEPLIYVDGVRVDNAQATGPAVQAFGSSVINRLNDFNPDDIESIEIIKGPAAATLYGTEASNGVIQIITKRGTPGTPQFSFTTRQGGNWVMDAEGRSPTNYWRNPDTQEVETINFYRTERERGTPLWRTGHLQGYTLNVSGGAEGVHYYVAGDLEREEGAEWDNVLRRRSMRANLTITPHDDVEVQVSSGWITGRTDLSCEAGCGGTTWANWFSTPAHNQVVDGVQDRRRGARSFTPEAYYEIYDRFQEMNRFTGSIQLRHTPTDWLTQRLVVGTDQVSEDNQTIAERTAIYQEWFPSGTGSKSVGTRDVNTNTLDYSASVGHSFGDITSSTSAGVQYFRRMSKFVSATGNDFALPGLRVVNAAADQQGGETFVENTTVGIFGQQQFGWNDRLFLTVGIRADDNSAFGEEFDLVYYPKASAAWVVTEEPFWTFDFLNTLRLRTAYGATGQQPGAFDALRTFNAVAGPNDVSTVSPGSVGNSELGPERSTEFEVGFDAAFLNDRAGFEMTYYSASTKDAILLQSVAPSTGFAGSRFVNIGEIQSTGFEFLLTGQPVRTRSVDVDFTFSLATNDGKIVDLGGPDAVVEDAGFGVEHRVGYPAGSWFHHKIVSAELDANGTHIKSSMMCATAAGGSAPCYDGDENLIADRVHLGRTSPGTEGAFSTTVTLFDRIQLFGMLDFKRDYMKWDHVTRVRCALNNICEENVRPSNFDPVRVAAYQTGAVFGEEYIRDAGFVKLRELSATYHFPSEMAGRLNLNRASITMAGRNLHTWTNWTGIEPEAMFLGGARGGFVQLEQNHLPQLTQFVTTISVGF